MNEEIRVEPLAERQRAVMRVIATYHEATTEYPSARYVARRLGVSLATVQEHLRALCRKGWLKVPAPYAVRCWPS